MTEPVYTPPVAAPQPQAPIPAEPQAIASAFDGLAVNVRRNSSAFGGGRWEAYIVVGGVEWVIASRKLGGLDDDLQERATPGFKERRARRYAAESGRQRTEPGAGSEHLPDL